MLKLIPTPKSITQKEGYLLRKTIKPTLVSDARLQRAIDNLPRSEDGAELEFRIGSDNDESYTLEVFADRIVISANGASGAFYGIQTVRQLLTRDTVPCLYIEDRPDFSYRGFYHDITRGKVPTVETLKKLIDNMAYYKLNSLQLYIEHTFAFREFADSIDRTGYLTAEEIRELDNYCNENFIEFIPSIATFGHLYELLQKDRYKHLREIEDFEESEFFWENRQLHHTIDPTEEESFELIKSLIDQYMVNFLSDKFNICGDETFDLKSGRHKDEDTGKLYMDFVTKLIKYLQSKGKTVMMWADIILNHPEQIDKLPQGVQLLNWNYSAEPDEETFKAIQRSGRPQIVCPSTVSWCRLCEDHKTEIVNISKMAEYGFRYGAEGVLNTNWGDWGNPCSIELAVFGLVFGAEKSWNVSTKADEEYEARVNHLVYGNDNGAQYITRLSEICSVISFYTFAKCYANIICGKKIYDVEFPAMEAIEQAVNAGLDIIASAGCDEWGNEEYKEEIVIAAEGAAVMAELMALHAGYSIERRTNTQSWLRKYRDAWLKKNKESELREIEKLFIGMERFSDE